MWRYGPDSSGDPAALPGNVTVANGDVAEPYILSDANDADVVAPGRATVRGGSRPAAGGEALRAITPASTFYVIDRRWSGYVSAGTLQVFDGTVTPPIHKGLQR